MLSHGLLCFIKHLNQTLIVSYSSLGGRYLSLMRRRRGGRVSKFFLLSAYLQREGRLSTPSVPKLRFLAKILFLCVASDYGVVVQLLQRCFLHSLSLDLGHYILMVAPVFPPFPSQETPTSCTGHCETGCRLSHGGAGVGQRVAHAMGAAAAHLRAAVCLVRRLCIVI